MGDMGQVQRSAIGQPRHMHASCCGRGLERCMHMLAAVLVVLCVQSGSGPLAVGAEMEVLSPRNRELCTVSFTDEFAGVQCDDIARINFPS